MKHHSEELGVDGLQDAKVEIHFGSIVLFPTGEDLKLMAAFDGQEVA